MSEACSTRGSEVHTQFWSVNLNERGHSQDLDIDGEILEWILGAKDRNM